MSDERVESHGVVATADAEHILALCSIAADRNPARTAKLVTDLAQAGLITPAQVRSELVARRARAFDDIQLETSFLPLGKTDGGSNRLMAAITKRLKATGRTPRTS